MDAAARRASYADARFVHTRVERLRTRNGAVDRLDSTEEVGIGVRVWVAGAWGFACCGGTAKADAEEALERALGIAAAQPAARASESQPLAPEPPARGEYVSPAERDPFDVPLEEKLAVLMAADAGLRTEPGVVLTIAQFEALRVNKLFASTEGALYRQVLTECGGGLTAVAVDGDESQTRSFPASHGGHVAQAGYEHFLSLDLAGEAPRVSDQAVSLLRAPACPPGRRTVILAGEQLGLQVHESIGHAVELDRVLGRELSYAGTSFVPAAGIGLERSGGCMRADGHTRQPIVRMTNVNLDPGDAGTLEDLIAATDEGLLIDTNRSWSIDNRRLHFQFEGEAAWEISGGKRGRLLRNPSYAGVTPEFWAGCDAVCSPSEWALVSLLDCGKGEPGQVGRASTNTSDAPALAACARRAEAAAEAAAASSREGAHPGFEAGESNDSHE